MKHISHSLALAGMLALALSACSSMHGWGSSRSGTSESGTSGTSGTSGSGVYDQQQGTSGTSGTTGGGSASMSESGAAGSMAGTSAGSQDQSQGSSQAGSSTAAASNPNATVVSIDVMPRQGSASESAGGMAGAAVGGSTAGSTGMSAGGDRVYRITLRMDDGSTRVVTQETTPDFRAGDRVNLTSGMIAH